MSDIPPNEEQLLAFFKALADANRLKIIGLLAQNKLSVEELAAALTLRPSTISHHLMILTEAGLVNAHAESYYNVYQLTPGALERMAQRLLAQDTLPSMAAGLDLTAYDQKVLGDFLLPDGRLKDIPAQRKKREAVLRHVLKSFEPGIPYTEQQINTILERFHKDTATLRRELLVYKMMVRDSGAWQVAKTGE
jgi:DNA-binding HxlR family transcriptional regulator